MSEDESHIEKIARIDANVQALVKTVPLIHQLDKDSAVNKRDHKIAISVVGIVILPVIAWVCKKLGISLL